MASCRKCGLYRETAATVLERMRATRARHDERLFAPRTWPALELDALVDTAIAQLAAANARLCDRCWRLSTGELVRCSSCDGAGYTTAARFDGPLCEECRGAGVLRGSGAPL